MLVWWEIGRRWVVCGHANDFSVWNSRWGVDDKFLSSHGDTRTWEDEDYLHL